MSALADSSRYEERQAAVAVIKRGLYIVGAAAYCNDRVSNDSVLVAAATAWSERNSQVIERAMAVLRATEDLTDDEKQKLERNTLVEVGRSMTFKPNCDQHRANLRNSRIELIARAFRWQKMLETGRYAAIKEIAKAEKINPSYVRRVLRLTLLEPDLVEALLHGPAPQRCHCTT
jgi:hypothetical protein